MTDEELGRLAQAIRDQAGIIDDAIKDWREDEIDQVQAIHAIEDTLPTFSKLAEQVQRHPCWPSPLTTKPRRTVVQIAAAHGPNFDQLYLYALASDGSLWVKGSGLDHGWGQIPF
jgi:hypothetical protein